MVLYLQDMFEADLPLSRIFKTWWPLAASWLLMGAELPFLTAILARLPHPEVNLAAYGGVVFPLALIIEAPIIMLLGASTALSKDWQSYRLIRRFMMTTSAILTTLHLLVALTPLYNLVVEGMLGVPQEIVAPARLGLIIMTPWTWSIAYRRFNQGVLIRFGYSNTVGVGTVIRLTADAVVLLLGYWIGSIPGIVVGAGAVSLGVISEAVYSGLVVRPVVKEHINPAPQLDPPLSWRQFFEFYIPLALTSLVFLLAQPIGSAALSRMPQALASLAAWPVISGLVFMFRSPGVAYNEVVVALLDQPRSTASLRRFTALLSVTTSLALLLTAATPLAAWWFERVSALPPELLRLAKAGIWLALPLPLMAVLQSWYQGTLLYGRATRGVSESVFIYIASNAAFLSLGVAWGRVTGLFIGVVAMALSMLLQTLWLGWRSRPLFRRLHQRDVGALIIPASQSIQERSSPTD